MLSNVSALRSPVVMVVRSRSDSLAVADTTFTRSSVAAKLNWTRKSSSCDLADAYEKELENRLGSLIAILEPLSTLAVGGVVLFMALSMLIPIYSGLDFAGS